MSKKWEEKVKAARRGLDEAEQRAALARGALHSVAVAAYRDGIRSPQVAEWARVTVQALHQWKDAA